MSEQQPPSIPERAPVRSDTTDSLHEDIRQIIQAMRDRHPALSACAADLIAAFRVLAATFEQDSCLYLCGNGGSMADAMHISAELLKSYKLPRPLDQDLRARLALAGPGTERLAQALQRGLRATVLGLNHSLTSALENDIALPAVGYAQELLALARPGDVLLAISTSGNAQNACHAAQVARARDLTVISLTGRAGGRLASLADIAIRAPSTQTDRVQEQHQVLYHCLCEMLEIHFFGAG